MIHGYIRVSTNRQAENSSPEEQERRIQAIATLRNDEELRIWRDLGVSGSIPLTDRPEGERMMAALRAGDTVVAAKLDRLFRNVDDARAQSQAWRERGIDLILVDMGSEPVTTSLTGRLYFTMLAAFAEFERGRIAERITEGRNAKRERGGFTGGHAPFGYQVNGTGKDAVLEIDPKEREIIDLVRSWSAHERSPTRLAQELTARGYRSRNGTAIRAAQVWRWLRQTSTIETIGFD